MPTVGNLDVREQLRVLISESNLKIREEEERLEALRIAYAAVVNAQRTVYNE